MTSQMLVIDWEYDQAGFIIRDIILTDDIHEYINEYNNSFCTNATIFKCYVPGDEIIKYFDYLCEKHPDEYDEVMPYLTHLVGYSDEIFPEMFGLEIYAET